MLWRYVVPYIGFALVAALFMVGEVCMDLSQPALMSTIVDDGILGVQTDGVGDMSVILTYGLIMCAAAICGVICGSSNNVFVQIAKQNIGNDLRKDIYRNIMGMSFSQVESYGTGALITRVTNDVTHVEMMVSVLVRGLIRTGFMLVGSIIMLFTLNPSFGMVLLLAFPIALIFMFACLRVVNPLFLQIQQRLDRLNAIMQEDLLGVRTVKSFVREVYEKVRFGKANDELIKTQLKALVIFAFMSPVMNVLMYGAIGGLLYVGWQDSLAGLVSAGAVVASLSYATQLLMSIMGVVMLAQDISRGLTSWKRIKEILALEPAMVDGTYQGGCGTEKVDGQRGASVEFSDVRFSYPNGATPVLDGVNLAIRPGERVAIMGSTGCGKTTLANLVSRFYDVTAGSVSVDGVDVREWDRTALRRDVICVLQRAEIFSGSVSDNVSWGLESGAMVDGQSALDDEEAGGIGEPGEGERLEAIARALRVAQADEFVSQLPGGTSAWLNAGGTNLSGGQRQRIGIARALAGRPRLLVLDDVTSALDVGTESRLLAALNQEFRGVTQLLVAQRISTARAADRIVIMDDGRVVATGTHEELMRDCAIYQEIAASQSQVDAYVD